MCPGTNTPRKETDARMFASVREQLLAPEALAEVQRMVHEIVTGRQRNAEENAGTLRKRRAELDAEIARTVEGIATVRVSEALSQHLRAAEKERNVIARQTSAARSPLAPDGAPAVLATYRRMVLELEKSMRTDVQEARAALVDIFGPIRVKRLADGIYAEIRDPKETILVAAMGGDDLYLTSVAGTGFEPVTFGL